MRSNGNARNDVTGPARVPLRVSSKQSGALLTWKGEADRFAEMAMPAAEHEGWWRKLDLEREDLLAIPVCLVIAICCLLFSANVFHVVDLTPQQNSGILAAMNDAHTAGLSKPLTMVREFLGW
jgi:hypothetical protein